MPFCDNTHQSKLKWVKKVEPDTTEYDWENEGGMALPHVDDNTPREELDTWRKKSSTSGDIRYIQR